LAQIGGDFEVVVVDQNSTDGSLEILKQYEASNSIRLFHQTKRNRGLGRQLAFEKSTGEYIISNVDMDDVYEPKLEELTQKYHANAEGTMLRVVDSNRHGALTLSPRRLVSEIGGWKDLDYVEDRFMWGSACSLGKYRWTSFPIYRKITETWEKRGVLGRTGRIYGVLRDRERIGARRRFVWYTAPIFVVALLSAWRRPSIKNKLFRTFWPDDPKFCISL
jgi:glycosyltransferase involved in cell wall biosynthesis